MLNILIYLLGAYLLGSLPFGLFAGFIAGKDVRREGSGNIGFTNVTRVCGLKFGLPVLVLDALKGATAVWLAHWFIDPQVGKFHWLQGGGGVIAVVGHSFPAWLKFRGGKGVATSAGVAAAIIPQPLLAALLAWLLVVTLTRYVSLGSMAAAATTLLSQIIFTLGACWSAKNSPGLVFAILIVLLVFARHRANLRRLCAGTESKFSLRKKPPPAAPTAENPENAADISNS